MSGEHCRTWATVVTITLKEYITRTRASEVSDTKYVGVARICNTHSVVMLLRAKHARRFRLEVCYRNWDFFRTMAMTGYRVGI
jgi:hypothetical protein